MAYSAVAMPSSPDVRRRRRVGCADEWPGRASITLVRSARRVVLVDLLMVVLLWLVGISAPLLPNGRRARPTRISPPRGPALRGFSALWRPPAVPGLWHRGPPALQPICPAAWVVLTGGGIPCVRVRAIFCVETVTRPGAGFPSRYARTAPAGAESLSPR